MRKLKIILFIAIFICLAGITSVYAADATAVLNVDKNTAKPGDTITVTLDAACSKGLSYVGTQIDFDSGFTVESETISNKWKNYGDGKLELMIDTQEVITSGTLYTLVLKINDTAEEGKLRIYTTEIEIMDKDNGEYTNSPSEQEITIEKKEADNPGTPGTDDDDGNGQNPAATDDGGNGQNPGTDDDGGNSQNPATIDDEKNDQNPETKDDKKQETKDDEKDDKKQEAKDDKKDEKGEDTTASKNQNPYTGKEDYLIYAAVSILVIAVISFIAYKRTEIA